MPRLELGIPNPAYGWDYTPPSVQGHRPKNLIEGNVKPFVLPEDQKRMDEGTWTKEAIVKLLLGI